MSDHEELESSIAAWVLGAIEGPDADGVRAHIDGCASCGATATRLKRAVGALPLAVDEVAPPARLRARVLAAAAATRSADPAAVRVRLKAVRTPPDRRPLIVPWFSRIPIYAAAAAVVVALAVGALSGALAAHGTPPPATAQVARFTLTGHAGLAGAQASVIDLKSDGVALVDFSGLPTLENGRIYELWLITAGGRADPGAVFVPDTNGAKVVVVSRSLAGYSEMAITSEVGPSGTQAPTQAPQLYGSLV